MSSKEKNFLLICIILLLAITVIDLGLEPGYILNIVSR